MNNALFLVGLSLCMLMCTNPMFANDNTTVDNDTISSIVVKEDYSPQLIEKIKVERNSIYNALSLTPEQIKKKNDLDEKRYKELQPKLKQFCVERRALKDLESKKADAKTIKTAQDKLDSTKNDIKKISSKYDKEFKKILTSEQKSKYNTIIKLTRADLKELEQRQKEMALKPFGVPVTQAQYTQQQKENHSLKNLFKRNKK